MESFGTSDIIALKANAIKKHHQRQKIANLFRIVEVCLVLGLISRYAVELPIAFKNSGEYFKDLSIAMASPRFVFVIGNVIVIVLFAKSGQFSTKNSLKTDIYKEFLEKSERSQGVYRDENREKQSTLEEQRIVTGDTYNNTKETKHYRRSQSAKSKSVNCDNLSKELRRNLTEKGEGLAKKKSYAEDNMSNEEFRQTIEAFIAKQQRFIREEECSVF
ncbi:hypothetical protein HS088_TW07G01320 [Tripterygium wilfordii]|uniref:DUF4408 domain-containing protein n=1 Tax=Tripterygium wilfordii TaxID=458696 RepID=A0A7J7DHF3_TRIWF|nr:uncharacterized protein LOC120003014 [Tripterygium wilfordii]KAF5745728.1 hypothetical protein HS088_TW07G01320 [Tripterygium wilfordii]